MQYPNCSTKEFSDHLPLFSDVTDHLTLRLPTRHLFWRVNPAADTTASVSSSFGDIQTVSYIVDSCLLTKLDGGLRRLHTADKAAVDWLTS